MTVQLGKPKRSDKPEPIMAWARRVVDSRVVHVSMFTRKEKGLGCRCVCAGCGGLLEAVNPGRSAEHFDKPGTHRMSFRHHAGTQGGECRLIASRAALLQLLLDSGKVQLPGYRAKGRHRGLRGEEYVKEAVGEPLDEQIQSAVWIDTHSAKITLPNGRVVRFQLRAETHVDASVDAVITILINDPEVAAWDQDKILSLAQLDAEWMCWEKHWDQDTVQAQADVLAQQEAALYCDAEPVVDGDAEDGPEPVDLPYSDPTWLAKLTETERQETLLHRILKDLLAEAPRIRVGGHAVQVVFQPRRGVPLSEWVSLPACVLTLSKVHLEQHLGNIVPDVMCQADESAGLFHEAELLVEIAVTHRVDEIKRAKIRARGTPCLELDATRLAGPRKLTVDALRELIQTSPEAYQWIYNPRFDERAEQVRLRLEAEYEHREQIKEREEQAARARERQARERVERQEKFKRELSAKPFETLTKDYYRELTRRRFAITLPEWEDETHQAYAAAFASQGQIQLAETTLQKLLVYLYTIRRAMEARRRNQEKDLNGTHAYDAMDAAAGIMEMDLRAYLPMLFTCLRISGARTDDEDIRKRVIGEANRVRRLVDEGSTYYARPSKYIEALRLLFPEFKEAFSDDACGTEAYAARRTHTIREKRQARERAEVLAEHQRRDVVEEQKRLEIETALQPAVGENWTFGGGKPFERWSRYGDAQKRAGQGHFFLIRDAYEAREQKQSVAEFIRSREPRTVEKVEAALAVLRSVYLLA